MSTKIKIQLQRPHPNQAKIIKDLRRFNVICCGRRFGKTVLGMHLIIRPALSGKPVAWFAPTYKMMLEAWNSILDDVRGLVERVSRSERRIELITGGVIEFWSLDKPDVARGRKYAMMVIDESAMIPKMADAWNKVLRPTLMDYAGGAMFLSTPRGRNDFYHMFLRGQDPEDAEWYSAQYATSDNPYIKPDEIEEMRNSLPDASFRQEVLAEFIDDAGGVFRNVRACIGDCILNEGKPEVSYIYGVDWGKHNDYTVITVIDASNGNVVCIDRFNKIDYRVQRKRLEAMVERFPADVIIAERNSIGAPIIEELESSGLPIVSFNTTNQSKKEAIEALSLALERNEIVIPNDSVLISELEAFEVKRTRSDNYRYSAPEGMHDDCVMSLALAWYGIKDGAGWFAVF